MYTFVSLLCTLCVFLCHIFYIYQISKFPPGVRRIVTMGSLQSPIKYMYILYNNKNKIQSILQNT